MAQPFSFPKMNAENLNFLKTIVMRKLKCLALLLVFFISATAQQKTGYALSFNHQALSVKDLQRSGDFYKNVLGLEEITNRTQSPGIRWFSLGEGKELHLISGNNNDVKVNKSVHLALTTPKFDEFVKYLSASKIPYSDWPGNNGKINIRSDGIKQIYIQDPDGYWIEINSVAQ